MTNDVLPKRFTRNFWLIQLLVWIGYAILRITIMVSLSGSTKEVTLYTAIFWSFSFSLNGLIISSFLYFIYSVVRFSSMTLMVLVSTLLVVLSAYVLSMANIAALSLLNNQNCCGLNVFQRALYHWPEQISLLAAWTGIYFGYSFYRQSTNDQALAVQASSAANQAELEMLRYQLHPHILFNSLNTISGLIVGGRDKEADRMVQSLGQFLQHMLQTRTNELIPLEEEISYITRYLKIEKIRFEDRLEINVEIADEIKTALVPAFILQPLVENAVKHGLNVNEESCNIEIHGVLKTHNLHVRIDTYTSGNFSENLTINGAGIGEHNVLSRLKLHYGGEAEFVTEQPTKNHYRAQLIIPFTESNSSNKSS